MKILYLTLVAGAGILAVSCSEKSSKSPGEKPPLTAAEVNKTSQSDSAPESEGDSKKEESKAAPESEEIGEDCVAFLRATKAVPAQPESTDCPTCPGSSATVEVLQFERFEIGKVSLSGSNCEVSVRIHAQFNPSSGGAIVGGLTGWISPAQKEQYAQGKAPSGPQVYKVKVIYQRRDGRWQAIEFDRD